MPHRHRTTADPPPDNTPKRSVTGQSVVEPLTGHADGITHAAFHPDGHLLPTSSDDCTTRLWAQPGLPAGHSRSVGARARLSGQISNGRLFVASCDSPPVASRRGAIWPPAVTLR
ncbi:WD40 repeat domain-containing protein [Streptomyces umbrinus]|uniref:WD40 repeat domain-containing protein n=1 Tax=Streptomyces umbrinus TaxID=67370 RepID=UPI003C2EA605